MSFSVRLYPLQGVKARDLPRKLVPPLPPYFGAITGTLVKYWIRLTYFSDSNTNTAFQKTSTFECSYIFFMSLSCLKHRHPDRNLWQSAGSNVNLYCSE